MSSTGLGGGVTSVHSPGSLMDGPDKDLVVMVRGAGLSGRVVARPLVLTLQALLSLPLSSPQESQQVSRGAQRSSSSAWGRDQGSIYTSRVARGAVTVTHPVDKPPRALGA